MTDLRAERRAVTRERIVQAALSLMADDDPAAVSMPAVAEVAGISLRTLYRYFPTKGELLDAAGAWFDGRTWAEAAGRIDVDELRPDDLLAYQRARFADFAANLPGVIVQLSTATGRELRRERVAEQRQTVLASLRSTGIPLDGDDLDRLVDAIIATSSSALFLELVERLGQDPRRAADLSVWMVQAMVAHAAATGTTEPIDGATAVAALARPTAPERQQEGSA
ncbi:MAG: TetR/AcrR family transcriptional regulator [Actinomycetota bacterium]